MLMRAQHVHLVLVTLHKLSPQCTFGSCLADQEHQHLSDGISELSSHSDKFTLSIPLIVWHSDGTSPKTQSEGSRKGLRDSFFIRASLRVTAQVYLMFCP